jgi:thiol-disulfide isomerase/thioredoxin
LSPSTRPDPSGDRLRLILLTGLFLSLVVSIAAAPAALATTASASADSLDLSAYRGKVVYLDFWASWCGPCKASFPWLEELQKKYGPQGFVVLAVNLDRRREMAERFLSTNPVDFKILYDPQGKLATKLQVKVMPTSFIYDRNGVLRETHTGFQKGKTAPIEQSLEALLEEEVKDDAK